MNSPTTSAPRVFVSYSADSAGSVRDVLNLANRLRQDGIDAIIDQYTDSPPEGWPRWLERQIDEADFVLMVISEAYAHRFEAPKAEVKGRGVAWEANLILNSLYQHERGDSKFVPVLLQQEMASRIPEPLRSRRYYTIPEGYLDLLRLVTNQAAERSDLVRRQSSTESEPLVFISYSVEDRDVAEAVSARLRRSGLHAASPAHQALASGDSIRRTIQSAVKASDFFLVLLSQRSAASPWVASEISSALGELEKRDITVLPVLLEDCELPIKLRPYSWFDLRQRTPERMDALVDSILGAPLIDFGKLTPREFERLVADVLERLEFSNIRLQSGPGDSGIDIAAEFASKDPFGRVENERWVVQVKRYKHERLKLESLRELAGLTLAGGGFQRGLLVTNAMLTSVAKEFLSSIKGGGLIRVLEGPELKRILTKYPELVKLYFSASEKRE